MNKYIQKTILLLVLLFPLFDVINSFFMKSGYVVGNISQFAKIIVLGLLFLFFLTKQQKTLVLGVSFIFSLIILLHFTFGHSSFGYLAADILFFGKLVFIPISLWGFTKFVGSNPNHANTLQKILMATWFFYALNAFLSLIGIGNTQYSSGGGLKGFFYAGNEFALAFLLICAMLFGIYLSRKQYIRFLAFAAVSVTIAFMIGFKTTMFGVIIAVVAGIYFFANSEISALIKKNALVAGISVSFIAILSVSFLFQQGFFARTERHLKIGVIHYLTGSRDSFAEQSLIVFSELTTKEKLVGIGKKEADARVGQKLGRVVKASEIDPIDLLLYGGVLSVVIVFGTWIVALCAIFLKNNSPQRRYLLFISFLLLIISSFAGHVIYAGIAIPYWGILVGLLLKYENDTRAQKRHIVFLGSIAGGGIRSYIDNTTAALRREGIDVDIIGTHYGSLKKTILQFPVNIGLFLFIVAKSSFLSRRLIFHYHMATKGSFVRKLILATLFWPFTNKQVIHLHGGTTSQFFAKVIETTFGRYVLTFFFSLFSNIVFVSNSQKEDCCRTLSVFDKSGNINKKCSVLFNAIVVSPPRTLHRYDSNQPIKLLFVGRLTMEKNLSLLVDIAVLLKNKNVHYFLDIYGAGEQQSLLADLIHEQNLHDHVLLKGWASQTQLPAIYQEHDLFIITSKFESFGLVVLEANNNGVPALVTKIGGMQDIIEEGKNGYLFELDDSEGFVSRIIDLQKNPEKLHSMQKESLEVAKKFDYKKHVKELLEIYDN